MINISKKTRLIHILFVGWFIGLYFGCGRQTQGIDFGTVICDNQEMPAYDELIVSFINNEGVSQELVLEKYKKKREIFKPCVTYIYKAKFFDKKNDLILQSQIKMMAVGKRWELQPSRQDEVIVQYEFKRKDRKIAEKYRINKSLPDFEWIRDTKMGIIENENKIWMHPFRNNQFSFTEVAPFPEIKYPLEIGKTWTGNLTLQEGWGDWDNSSGNFSYLIKKKEDITIPYGVVQGCYKVESKAKYPFGESLLDFWFHEKLGFVKFNYLNYEGQRSEIELMEVVQH